MDDEFTQTLPHLPSADLEYLEETEELPVLMRPAAQDLRNYSRAFLGYYRARKILSANRNIRTVTRERALHAWQYLSTIDPQDLPSPLKPPHRDIVTLASRLEHKDASASAIEFVTKILDISMSIDEMVDDVLIDTTEPT